ncbi:protein of unknown function [Xenorhabdus doucetiae]|uniref:Uncharacterized protein n=1 Tax=Xenorhabdus doucetiae TaxID=351671 RepID=A0A068QMG6_9GAMM|nr:protein of unknown function [Xenorhabdus doucetiae]
MTYWVTSTWSSYFVTLSHSNFFGGLLVSIILKRDLTQQAKNALI